jgi:hypothetical protein
VAISGSAGRPCRPFSTRASASQTAPATSGPSRSYLDGQPLLQEDSEPQSGQFCGRLPPRVVLGGTDDPAAHEGEACVSGRP